MEYFDVVDADEQLRQIVRKANCHGPQHVAVDEVAVVVLSEMEYGRLVLSAPPLQGDGAREPAGVHDRFGRDELIKDEPDREAVSWPWDWDCERREWVLPVDDAAALELTRRCA